jgi:hypothetical protein
MVGPIGYEPSPCTGVCHWAASVEIVARLTDVPSTSAAPVAKFWLFSAWLPSGYGSLQR